MNKRKTGRAAVLAAAVLALLAAAVQALPFAARPVAAETTAPSFQPSGTAGESEVTLPPGNLADAADDTAKTYVVLSTEDTPRVDAEGFAFWERPALPAGQTREGTLTIQNRTGGPLDTPAFRLSSPAAGGAYLEALRVRVARTDAPGGTLFQGSYAELIRQGLSPEGTLGDGESVSLTVTLFCPFNYAGGAENPSVLWSLWAEQGAEGIEVPYSRPSAWVWIAFFLAVLVTVGTALLRVLSRRTK